MLDYTGIFYHVTLKQSISFVCFNMLGGYREHICHFNMLGGYREHICHFNMLGGYRQHICHFNMLGGYRQHICHFNMLGGYRQHICHSPNEGLKIATDRRPLSFWIMSSATALLNV